jgi:hypothetical protein
MNAIAKPWPGNNPARSKQRRQLIVLGCLSLVLLAMLAWEGPKLLHHSGSSSAPVATSAAATPAVTTAPAVGATGGAAISAAAASHTKVWISHQHARDPFVPLAGAQPAPAAAAAPAATPAPVASAAATAAAANSTHAASASAAAPTVTVTAPPAAAPANTATPEPAAPAKVAPSIAVVYANGKKHDVAVGQYFEVSDLWFRLDAVDSTTMKISLVNAGFSGGKDAITVLRDHPVKLVNNATGVEYSLRFTQGTSGIATDSQTEPTTAPSATPTAAAPSQASAPATTSPNES